jgi:hypothetical protein
VPTARTRREDARHDIRIRKTLPGGRLVTAAKELTRSAVVFSIIVSLIVGAAIVLIRTRGDGNADLRGEFAKTGLSMRELERASSRLRRQASSIRPAAPAGSSTQVASVPSLIGGLELRLESNPDDAGGWALLAQSYAFTGRLNEAEGALQRAVELGFDETDLRQRVQTAKRDPHADVKTARTVVR